MRDLRFPTQLTEHVLYYIQFEFYVIPPLNINTENLSSGLDSASPENAEAVGQLGNLFNYTFSYDARAEKLDDTITLPLVNAVEESTSANYEETSMRGISNLISAATGGGTSGLLMDLAGKIPGVTESMVKGLGFAQQKAVNERMKVFYNGPTLREYEFEFPLIPKNLKDAKTMVEISKRLQFHASPTVPDETVWGYPNLVQFRFLRTRYRANDELAPDLGSMQSSPELIELESLFKSKKCYINNVGITHGDDRYFQFSDGVESETGAMTISISLKEIDYRTQSDFGEPINVADDEQFASNNFGASDEVENTTTDTPNTETTSEPEQELPDVNQNVDTGVQDVTLTL